MDRPFVDVSKNVAKVAPTLRLRVSETIYKAQVKLVSIRNISATAMADIRGLPDTWVSSSSSSVLPPLRSGKDIS